MIDEFETLSQAVNRVRFLEGKIERMINLLQEINRHVDAVMTSQSTMNEVNKLLKKASKEAFR